MTDNNQITNSNNKRRLAKSLLAIILIIFIGLIGLMAFAPAVLNIPLFGNPALPLGLPVAFAFIVFIVVVMFVYTRLYR